MCFELSCTCLVLVSREIVRVATESPRYLQALPRVGCEHQYLLPVFGMDSSRRSTSRVRWRSLSISSGCASLRSKNIYIHSVEFAPR